MIDTKKLESFAAAARTQLITEVTARLTAVLAPSSTARIESPSAVRALEADIRAHGGDAVGRKHVIEQQAYVWFNRIIAFRFMDANGYTTTPVVSPEGGRTIGQPATLAAAKRGEFDPSVFTRASVVQRITGLLNGTIPSSDRDGEAYSLILAAYCAAWNMTMPFMFKPEGDYTELLMPASLLAEGSVLTKAVRTLTVEDCQDVEVIGWLYQFYIAERKDEVFAGFKKNKKAGPDEIPAATQLFTPDWIVRYLVQNSLGRLWMLNHPGSKLVEQMEYYIRPVDVETDFLRISGPEELKIIDPACGSGHMLTYAFDLLYAIYEEEGYAASDISALILEKNLFGCEIDERAGALAAFALAMKARAKQRRFFFQDVEPNICVLTNVSFTPNELRILVTPSGDLNAEESFWNQFASADTFGSLIQPDATLIGPLRRHVESMADDGTLQAHELRQAAERVLNQAEYLTERYNVVVANPPYMGGANMGAQLGDYVKQHFSEAKSDLFSAFIYRVIDLVCESGQIGLMTPFVWMFIGSYESMRRKLLTEETLTSLIQLEYSGFEGATVPICTFTFEKEHHEYQAGFVRLSDFVGPAQQQPRTLDIIEAANAPLLGHTPTKPEMADHFYRRTARQLSGIPGSPIAYWLPDTVRSAFEKGEPLASIAEPRQGLITGDVVRFIRQWWEVSYCRTAYSLSNRLAGEESGARWFPHNKGGEFRKWWGNQEYVVNWENDGKEIRTFGTENGGKARSRAQNTDYYFRPSISWSLISSSDPAFRLYPAGFIFDVAGMSAFTGERRNRDKILGIGNSSFNLEILRAIAPTLNFNAGDIGRIPVTNQQVANGTVIDALVEVSRQDWNDSENSWDFESPSLLKVDTPTLLDRFSIWHDQRVVISTEQQRLEEENNRLVAETYGLIDEVPIEVPLSRVSLNCNVEFAYGPGKSEEEYRTLAARDAMIDLISYAVGCMMGRYSLDEPGLILASQGETAKDYLARVPRPSFAPDDDGIIPITGGEWFTDDIVARFRQFLKVTFGEEHFEENLRFVEESLGTPGKPKDLRSYFLKDFYADHVQKYKNRPIYWMFSSQPGKGKGAFNALVYMHRYTPAMVHSVLTKYLREFQTKLRGEIASLERDGDSASARKADALRKDLTECDDYERDVLFPLATRNIEIDLDDGILVNYLRFGKALSSVPAIEKKRKDVETWTWPKYPLTVEDA